MNKWMKIAFDEALEGISNDDGGPFGAVIVKNGEIISTSHNEVLKSNDPTAHAEVIAIQRASKKLKSFNLEECELYTTSKPCPMCLGAVFWSRIKTVYYGTSEDDVAKIGFDDKKFYDYIKGDKKGLRLICIEHTEALKLLKKWEQKEDKEIY